MPKRNIVVIGGSVGGLEALRQLVQGLPVNYGGTVFIVLHTGPGSVLPEILTRAGHLPAVFAENNRPYEPGHIYCAPPDRHLLINDGLIQLDAGPRENASRPSIDPLFRSAARTFRDRVIGVILSGMLDDGSAGLFAVKARGGIAVVQDPGEAAAPDMPLNAMTNLRPDYCLKIAEVAPLLVRLASDDEVSGGAGLDGVSEAATEIVDSPGLRKAPPPSETQIPLSCPECNGSLYEQKEGDAARFICHIGHSFSPMALSEAHKEALERALWTAVRTLNERVMMHRKLGRAERNASEDTLFHRLEERAASAERDVQLLREIVDRI